MRVVVLGAGNTLMRDEGVGVFVIERLLETYDFPDEVHVFDGGTSSMEMLEDLENLDALIIVDAVYAHQAPGEVVKLVDDDFKAFFRRKLSPHQIGLADVLASLEFMDRAPSKMVVIGVKPVELELSMELTPQVAAQVPRLMDMVVSTLAELGLSPTRKVR